MKKVCIFGIFLISFFLLIFPKRIQAQGTCTSQKNLATQTCELDQNNCQNHYIPWVHEVNNICDCDCISDPNDPPPTPQPTATPPPSCPGTCRTTGCWGNETPNNSYSCPNPQATCCIPLAATPTTPPGPGGPTGPGGGGTGDSIQTAIGPINPTNLQSFVQQLLNLAFGVAGGVAFLLMLFGVFQVMTSGGNPEKMKSGSELITSALTGLLFIVFSIFILKLIGVQILDIPGFGR